MTTQPIAPDTPRPAKRSPPWAAAVSGAWKRCTTAWPESTRSNPAIWEGGRAIPRTRPCAQAAPGTPSRARDLRSEGAHVREILEVFFVIHDPTTLNRQGNDSRHAVSFRDFLSLPRDKRRWPRR